MADKRRIGDEITLDCELIKVHVTDLKQLFNPIDPSPPREKDLASHPKELTCSRYQRRFAAGTLRNLAQGVSVIRSTCLALVCLLGAVACAAQRDRALYKTRVRELTITTVPLLTKEMRAIYPFLVADFGKGAVLDGKEVYAFSPSSLTVFQGDTIHFTLINPEDDAHSFILPDLAVALPPQSTVKATYVARNAGVFEFVCSIPSHLPMMYGQLVVLATR